jgi:hypothetical protein
MINSKQKKVIAATTMTVLLGLMISLTQEIQIYAEEDEKKYTSANDIAIHTVFNFREGSMESDGFQVYKQMSGFARHAESPMFKLEGVVDSDKAYLYEAADMAYHRGDTDNQHKFALFEVDIYLHIDGVTLRHFSYKDCEVTDYAVTTLFDKEEGWTTSKGFAIVDEFVFECNGYKPNNPLYDLMKTNGYTVESNSKSTLDLDSNLPTWESHPKFQSVPFEK